MLHSSQIFAVYTKTNTVSYVDKLLISLLSKKLMEKREQI